MTKTEEYKNTTSLVEIAINKAYIYSQEYNPYSGQVEDKDGAPYLKQGFVEGFLAGFTHRLTGGNDED